MQCIYGVPKSAGASVATVGLLRALLCFYFLAPVYRCLIFWSCLYLELGELWRIQVGEDGPTHQPIETIPSLRLIPDLTVMRPADGNETAGAYKHFGQKDVKRMSRDQTEPLAESDHPESIPPRRSHPLWRGLAVRGDCPAVCLVGHQSDMVSLGLVQGCFKVYWGLLVLGLV